MPFTVKKYMCKYIKKYFDKLYIAFTSKAFIRLHTYLNIIEILIHIEKTYICVLCHVCMKKVNMQHLKNSDNFPTYEAGTAPRFYTDSTSVRDGNQREMKG